MSALGDAATPRPSRLGRYELITQIGQGGMAEVQLAIQRGPAGFEKLVVVKLVHANLATQKTFVDMLLDEARIAALVKHPNVVDIYDLGEAEGRYFIAMEYLEGEPLLAVLRAGREGKRLDPLSTARLIADTAEGLDAAHELRSMGGDPIELVHHDVSLGNIVVLYNGQVKLVDFGVAKATMSSAAPTKVQGKFSYMAPEKLRGGSGDRRSDIWSLGCVLWEALTLRRLFKGGNDNDTMRQVLESAVPPPSTVNGDVLADFDAIVMRALERDPEKRFPSAKEMAIDLEEVLRKQGYGGRNDQIAKYMTATFETHIVARKKLLQEVSSKGRASAAVLEAAFAEPSVPDVRTSGEFSVKFRRPTGEIVAEGTPQRTSSPSIASASANASANANANATYPRASAEHVAAYQASPTNEPAPQGDAEAPPSTRPDSYFGHSTDAPKRYRKHYIAITVAAAALVSVIVVSVIVATRSRSNVVPANEPSQPIATTPVDAAAASETPRVGSGSSDAGSAKPAGSGSKPVAIDPTIEIEPSTPTAGAVKPAVRPNPKANAAELYRTGIQEFAAGDYKTALTTLRRAQVANPGYAPTYRGFGLVYAKLGQNAAAKAAFQRYLALAPNASDAASIRARMGQL